MKEVHIYTWTFCPFCIRAKRLLDKEAIPYKEIVIDGDQAALSALKTKTGSGSVPQIFVGEDFIGGCDELHALHRDKDAFNARFGR